MPLFVTKASTKIRVSETQPYLIGLAVALAPTTCLPGLSLWPPRVFGP